MSDISKCQAIGCPLKEKCVRFKSESSEYQSYLAITPYNFKTRDCKFYWSFKMEQKLKMVNR